MKILITGSNGLLGNKLIDLLLQNPQHQLIATSSGDNRYSNTGTYLYESLDICDKQAIQSCLSKYNPDVVINTAAMTHVDQCENNQEVCWRLNVEAVQYLADATDDLNIHFVHISTDFIFDGKAGPYKEEDEPNPLSYYGKSKLASEEVVQSKKGSWSILRTVLVYGYTPNLSRTNIVLWAKGALEQGQTLNVVDDQFRTPTLAEDLAKACLLAAEQKAKGIYHISGEDFFSVIDIVYGVADFWNLDKSLINRVNSQILAQPANRPPKTGFIITKAKNELGFAPLSFQAGLAVVDASLKK